MSISSISGNLSLTPANQSNATSNTASNVVSQVENSFSSILKNLEDTQETSDNLLKKLSAGEDVDLSQLMIATEQTDINFKVAMSIRDRLVDAYKEVIRITV
jgi:flagellar hook-basal body complex protein FliE